MIVNKDFVIITLANFLSDYILKSKLKNFVIYKYIYPNTDLLISICENARSNCGANILLSYDNNKKYNFARNIIPNDNLDECLIVSPLCRTLGILKRHFDKHKDNADVYPLLDLYESEIFELLNLQYENKDFEYIDRENIKNNIINSDESPLKNKDWFKYTIQQKKIIAELHAREKKTRHKDLISRGAIYPILTNKGILR